MPTSFSWSIETPLPAGLPRNPVESIPMVPIGQSACGTFPCGYGTPGAAAEAIGTTDLNALYINPNTKDFELDDWCQFKTMSPVAQRVQLCISTALGSVQSSPTFGFKPPPKVGVNILHDVRSRVENALLPVTSDGSANLLDVQIQQDSLNPNLVYALITFKDNTTDKTYMPKVILV